MNDTSGPPDGGGITIRAIRPGDSIAIRVEFPAAADALERISALESRIWLELDGAALTVDQEYTFAVEGNTPLRSETGAPLLCIPLPEGLTESGLGTEAPDDRRALVAGAWGRAL